jgi:hypothetical protein
MTLTPGLATRQKSVHVALAKSAADAAATRNLALSQDVWLRHVELDSRCRQDWRARFNSPAEPPCNSAENELLDLGLEALTKIKADAGAAMPMKRASTCDEARTWYDRKSHRMYGNVQLSVWGASALEVLAFLMHPDAHFFQASANQNDCFFHVVGEHNAHHRVTHFETGIAGLAGFRNRSFLNVIVCKQLSDKPPTFAWVTAPIERYEGVRDNVGVVRAECFRFCLLSAVEEHVTRMEYVSWLDLGGAIPKGFVDHYVTPRLTDLPVALQLYFFQIHLPATPEAGTLIANMLMDAVLASPRKEQQATISSFVSKMAALRSLRDSQFPHLCAMLYAVTCPTWRRHVPDSALAGRSPAHKLPPSRAGLVTVECSLVNPLDASQECSSPAAAAEVTPKTTTGASRIADKSPSLLVRLASQREFRAEAAQLTRGEALSLGVAITRIRMEHTVPERAVEELFLKTNMMQLDREEPWFRPMMHCIIKRKMADSSVSRTRLVFSTLISMFSLSSAIASTVVFFKSGQSKPAFGILGMIIICQALQVVIVTIRTQHCGLRFVLKEAMIILSGFKPVVDLSRTLRGREVDGAPFSTSSERVMMTCVETIVKSIPSSIISTLALATGQMEYVAFISTIISFVASAYRTMNMCCNLDADCDNRRRCPRFYGYLPQSGARRSTTKLALFLASLSHIVTKALSVSFLYSMGVTWLIGYLCADVVLHLIYKIA